MTKQDSGGGTWRFFLERKILWVWPLVIALFFTLALLAVGIGRRLTHVVYNLFWNIARDKLLAKNSRRYCNEREITKLWIVFASCLISVLIVEIALRFLGPEVPLRNAFVFHKFDPVLGRSQIPKSQGQLSGKEFSHPVYINSLGMRDEEIGPKRDDEFRVAFLGDSFTWGQGVSYGERFTELVELVDRKINALNFGVSGYSPI